MATTRIKRIGGIYKDDDFLKLLKQINGRAVLVVTIINQNCEECEKLHKFVGQLEHGFIDKMPQLVMLYGIGDVPLDDEEAPPPAKSDDSREDKKKSSLGDSRILKWDKIPDSHGYAIFTSETDVLTYNGTFDHDEFVPNILDSIRRFKSSIKSIAGLPGKRIFKENKRSGIIIETSGATQNSQIIELENKVKSFEQKSSVPIYFCKGISQEISYIVDGKEIQKIKGFKLEKLLKKIKK